MLKSDVSVFLTVSPCFFFWNSYDFTKHPTFDKAWFSGSSYSKSLRGCYFFTSTGHFKTSSNKKPTCSNWWYLCTVCPLFLPSWHTYANTMYTYMALPVSFPYPSCCRTLLLPKEAECGVQTKRSFYLRNTAPLLIFVSPFGAVAGEIRAGLADWAQSLITCARAELQLSWQHGSTCAFAYPHEVNFKCNFGIRLIRSLRDKNLCIFFSHPHESP